MEGKVVNDATGQPVSKATVMLRGPANAVFNTSTDEKGRYAFGGIEPGSYTLTAERAGFVTATYGAKAVIAARRISRGTHSWDSGRHWHTRNELYRWQDYKSTQPAVRSPAG